LLINGFKKIIDYPFIKKLLLLGFLGSGCFVTYSVSNIFGIMQVNDKDFIEKNRYYYDVTLPNLNVDKYLAYENLDGVNYILPGSGNISFEIRYPYYYQTIDARTILSGSLVASNLLDESDLIYGRMPQNKYEIVVDEMTIDKMLNEYSIPKEVGISSFKDLLNTKAYLNNLDAFIIVGITNKNDPSIYADRTMLINMLSNTDRSYIMYDNDTESDESDKLLDYTLIDKLQLKKGRLPVNDYEVIVNYNREYEMPLNKTIDKKVNGKKLTVVGYYEDNTLNNLYTNGNTIKYSYIENSRNITVMPSDGEKVIEAFNGSNLNIKSSYETSLNEYKYAREDAVKAGLIVSFVILAISFIEIYLMVRASFLSRIKEVGIYRAIGVKKSDIYKMFFGEIFAITTLACIPGVLFVSYCLSSLSTISYFSQNYLINGMTILISTILIYAFNLFVGLLPVANVIRQTPAQILARKDLD